MRETYHVGILDLVGDGLGHCCPLNVNPADLVAHPTYGIRSHWCTYMMIKLGIEVLRRESNVIWRQINGHLPKV